jgi:hypothetical protein
MSLASHVETLKRKHRALEDEIVTSERHPSADHLDVAALKKEKLRVKEEIEKLSSSLH